MPSQTEPNAADPKPDSLPVEADLFRKLREPFPKETIGKLPRAASRDSTKKGNCQECGKYHVLPAVHLDYVGHAAVTDRLLQVDPTWTLEPVTDERGIPIIERDGSNLALWARLTVLGVTRMCVGTCEAGKTDPLKQLISDALRNGAMRFGVALDLWSKEDLHQTQDDEPAPTNKATTAQVAEIMRLAPLANVAIEKILAGWKVSSLVDLTEGQATASVLNLESRIQDGRVVQADPETGEVFASQAQLQKLAIIAANYEWSDEERRSRAGVVSFKSLTKTQAHWLIEEWERAESEDRAPAPPPWAVMKGQESLTGAQA